ncbi:MAG: hypothetical protein N2167_00675 [Flavobacteriales bacterium]|nr:hypothetical protein [Flavobacteriales bacterium]
MKPFHVALPAAHWIMRCSLAIILLYMQWPAIKTVNFQQTADVISFAYVVGGILLIGGGFLKNSTLTILSAALIFLITLYFLYLHFPAEIHLGYLIYLWPLSVSLFYLANGNE